MCLWLVFDPRQMPGWRCRALALLFKCALASRMHVFFSISDHIVVVSVITVLCARALTGDRLSRPLHGSSPI